MFSEIKDAYNSQIKKQIDDYQNKQFQDVLKNMSDVGNLDNVNIAKYIPSTPSSKTSDDSTFGSSVFDDSISYHSILKKPIVEPQANLLYPIIFGIFMIMILDIFLNLGRTIQSLQ